MIGLGLLHVMPSIHHPATSMPSTAKIIPPHHLNLTKTYLRDYRQTPRESLWSHGGLQMESGVIYYGVREILLQVILITHRRYYEVLQWTASDPRPSLREESGNKLDRSSNALTVAGLTRGASVTPRAQQKRIETTYSTGLGSYLSLRSSR